MKKWRIERGNTIYALPSRLSSGAGAKKTEKLLCCMKPAIYEQ